MSEYQYYDFQAIDRPLDANARAELRKITSRAEITSTSLVNEYHFGDFKGDPAKLMEQYFDAFFYYANWGSRTVMLRLPLAGLTVAEVEPYLPGSAEGFSAWATKEHVILQYEIHIEDGWDYYDEEEGGSLAAIIPIRNELLNGDLRPLYLGWLLAAQQTVEEDEEDILEPPVPPGLKSLSGPQKALADFLDIDPDLIAAAAERSAKRGKAASPNEEKEQVEWVRTLPANEKDTCLLQLLRGEGASLGMQLQRRFRAESLSKKRKQPTDSDSDTPRRTVAELLARMEELEAEREEHERQEKERKEQEQERREAEARERRLTSLIGKEDDLWHKVETLLARREPSKYDEVVGILLDLRELANRAGTSTKFTTRLEQLRQKHASKRAFLDRLHKKGIS